MYLTKQLTFIYRYLLTFFLIICASCNYAFSNNIKIIKGLHDEPKIPRSAGFTEEFELIHKKPQSEDENIIKVIKNNIDSLPFPYLYEYSRRIASIDPEESIISFWRAGIRARYDALRCTDKSAVQAISYWPNIAKNVAELMENEKYKSKINLYINKAIKLEKVSFKTYHKNEPYTVCFHGMKAMTSILQNKEFKNWHTEPKEWNTTFNELIVNINKSLYKK